MPQVQVPASIARVLDPEGVGQVLSAVATLRADELRIDRARRDLVRGARERGVSWAGVGWLLGTTGEAARQRYGDRS